MPKTIFLNNEDITKDKPFTYLSEDVVATGTTIRVQSIVGFEGVGTSSGQIICIGKIGNERTELLRSSNTTGYNPSQSYKEVTLRDAMVFDHSQDTPVYIVDWNRFEVNHSSTATGTKSTLTAYPRYIDPGQSESSYKDTSQTSGFYFVRFNETVGDTNSDWSDPIPYAGYDDNTVFEIKKRALDSINEKIDDELITHEFLNKALWEGRREYHQARGKRPFRRKFNVDIGNALTGSFRIELPTDVEKPYNAQNVYGVRIGTNANMDYYDKKEWDFDYRDKPHSTLELPYVAGTSTSLWLTNGRDFGASAVVQVEGLQIGVTRYEYSLTGNSLYNSLRIYSHPSTTYNASAGSDVFENTSPGLPDRFTVWADPEGSAYIYFNRPIDTAYVGLNIFSDYYRTLVGYDSDADILDEPDYDMFVPYLAWRVKKKKNQGLDPLTDADYLLWQKRLIETLQKEYDGTQIRISPSIDHLTLPD